MYHILSPLHSLQVSLGNEVLTSFLPEFLLFHSLLSFPEVIGCTAFALQCYPLLTAGLIAFEAVIMGLVTPEAVFESVLENIQVILLLIFNVAAVYFFQDLLGFLGRKLFLSVTNHVTLSICFMWLAAFLAAWL